jgi:N utilization substance protein A
MNAEFIQALDQLEKEKGISKDVLIDAIENSLITACKNNFGTSQNIKVNIDREKGDVTVFAERLVCEKIEDQQLEITLEKAKEINVQAEIGDIINVEVTPKNFGRIATQKAKQVVVQKIREAERDVLLSQYSSKEKEIVTGIIQRVVKNNVVINLGKIDAILADKEQVPNERYLANERIKVYVIEVKESTKGPKIYVSRTHPELVKRLFEQEVPEVHDGVVVIKSISREPGSRTKIAVYSNNPNVDPVGSCVGHNGSRVGIIVSELNGEKIDIIPWNENAKEYISASLSPSKVVAVQVNEKEKSAKVVVPDYQLSLAIGKEGQNARLAAKLTGFKIDIKSETQAKEVGFIDEVIEPAGNVFDADGDESRQEDIFNLNDLNEQIFSEGEDEEDLFEE